MWQCWQLQYLRQESWLASKDLHFLLQQEFQLLKHQHHITNNQHGDEFDLEAEALYREVIKGRQTTLGYTHADTMNAIKHLATLLRHMPGRHAEAEQLMREVEGV